MKFSVEQLTYNQLNEFQRVDMPSSCKAFWKVSFDNGFEQVMTPIEFQDGVFDYLKVVYDQNYNYKSPDELQDVRGNDRMYLPYQFCVRYYHYLQQNKSKLEEILKENHEHISDICK